MIRLAAKLGAERKGGVSDPVSDEPQTSTQASGPRAQDVDGCNWDGREKGAKTVSLPPVHEPEATPEAQGESKNRRKKNKRKAKEAERRSNTKNMFEVLRNASDPDATESTNSDTIYDHDAINDPALASIATANGWEANTFIHNTEGWTEIEKQERKNMEMIPGFDDSFWQEFGNKLRVFGTEERVWGCGAW